MSFMTLFKPMLYKLVCGSFMHVSIQTSSCDKLTHLYLPETTQQPVESEYWAMYDGVCLPR